MHLSLNNIISEAEHVLDFWTGFPVTNTNRSIIKACNLNLPPYFTLSTTPGFERAILVHHARLTNFPLTAFREKIAWIEIVSNSGSFTRCIVSHCAHQVKKMLIRYTMTIRCIHLRNGISRGIRVGLMVYNMGPGSLLQMLFIVALELKGCFIVISIIFLTPKLHSTGADLDGENGYCLFF